ncbi:hypothetical protein C8R44DRAFT_869018 [Mycena epipterygia]|nr:hypothetical protein C8R44DRAFT_869018 [Mycena epipterygia]
MLKKFISCAILFLALSQGATAQLSCGPDDPCPAHQLCCPRQDGDFCILAVSCV